MTISSNPGYNDYTCNGSTVDFPFTFKVFADDELRVFVRNPTTGVKTDLVLNADYTVSGAGNGAGGTVTTVATWSSDYTLHIRDNQTIEQQLDLRNQTRYDANSVETELDRLAIIQREQQKILDRCIKIADGDTSGASVELEYPDGGLASKNLTFDSNGNVTSSGPVDDVIAVSAAMEPVVGAATLAAARAAMGQWSDALITPTGGTEARTIADISSDTMTVLHLGADPTGSSDSTSAIQAAINTSAKYIIVPAGTYRVDGTIEVPTFKTLRVDGILSRLAAHSASTRPVVLLNNCQLAKLCGRGAITTENASPDGIVCVGPEDPTVSSNQTVDVQWCTVEGVSLTGAGTGTGNRGVVVQCTAAHGGSRVCYQNWIRSLEIHTVGHGVYVGAQANANLFADIMMWNIGVAGINFAGDDGTPSTYPTASITDNMTRGLFVSNSTGITASILCKSASFNVFHGVHGEPGGGKLFSFDSNCESNYLTGVENHPQLGADLGSNNTIITNVTIRTNSPKFLAVLGASASNATGDGTAATINFNSEIFDTYPGGAFGGGGFTAPISGKYRLSGVVYLTGLGAGHNVISIIVATSNRNHTAFIDAVGAGAQIKTSCAIPFSVLADMDALDTALVTVTVSGSTKTVNVYGDGSVATSFAGELVA